MSVNLLTFAFRQIAAIGKDPSKDEVEKVELECVRIFVRTLYCFSHFMAVLGHSWLKKGTWYLIQKQQHSS